MNPLFESLSREWLAVLWRSSLQGAVAILLVMATVLILERLKSPAWVEHWLWKLVFLKLLLALVITQPIELPLLAPPEASAVADSPQLAASATAFTAELAGSNLLTASEPVGVEPLSVATVTEASLWKSLPSWHLGLAGVWLLGALANAWILSRQLLATWRLQLVPVTDARLLETCRAVAEPQELSRVPGLAVSARVSSPALVGWFRPVIVLPPETLRRCTPEQLRGVLAHELSHYRRGDLWWNLLPAVTQILFYFHPLLWLANRRWRLSSEMACDARALETSANGAAEYADSLLRIALLGSHRLQSQRCLGCVCVFDSARSLKQRLFAMKDYQPASHRQIRVYATLVALIAVLGTVPWQLVSRAAEPDPQSAAEADAAEASFGKNMGFEDQAEQGPQAMHWGGGGEGYNLTLDDQNPHSGTRCGRIEGKSNTQFGTYTQCIEATQLRGKRVQFSGYLRSDLKNNGGLWMRIDADNQSIGFDNMADRRIKGKTPWTEHQIVLDVPVEATKICFGFLMVGKGDLWADDFSIKVVGQAGSGPKTTGMARLVGGMPKSYANLDFEQASEQSQQTAKAWGGGGRGYELLRDTNIKHSGTASGRIRRTQVEGNFGTFTQMFSAKDFLNKRVRYSGFLKTQDADKAGLWMRVDGKDNKVLAFDNMDPRPVSGTTDWKQYFVVLDVPENATHVALGFLLIGDGTVWGDELQLEVVGKVGEGPETTNLRMR